MPQYDTPKVTDYGTLEELTAVNLKDSVNDSPFGTPPPNDGQIKDTDGDGKPDTAVLS